MKVVHVTMTPFRWESRIEKEVGSLLGRAGDAAAVLALDDGAGPACDAAGGYPVERMRLRLRPLPRGLPFQLLKYLEWSLRLRTRLRRLRPDVVHAHSLGSLAAVLFATLGSRARVIYDAHELETGTNGLRGLRRQLARVAERVLIRQVDATLVVNIGIADWYRHAYGIEPVVVRNVPLRVAAARGGLVSHAQPVDLRAACAVPADELLFVYLGALAPGRGIETVLEAFAGADRHHVVLLGEGPLRDRLVTPATAGGRIHWYPPVGREVLLATVASADVGLVLTQPDSPSYRLSLPNKLFECLLAGIPVIATDLPEVRRLLGGSGAGWLVDGSAAGLRAVVSRLSGAALAAARAEVDALAAGLDWEREAGALLALYRDLTVGATG